MVQKGGKSHGIEKHAVRNIKLPPELRALTFARALVTSLPFAYLQEKVGPPGTRISNYFHTQHSDPSKQAELFHQCDFGPSCTVFTAS